MQLHIEHLDEDLWVFGYGSLIWRPGFDYLERQPARLIGAHRALCVFSHVHRGTPERPGLVLGLDLGGACHGVAYRIAAKQRAAVIAYLRGREQVTRVYRETLRSVTLLGRPERRRGRGSGAGGGGPGRASKGAPATPGSAGGGSVSPSCLRGGGEGVGNQPRPATPSPKPGRRGNRSPSRPNGKSTRLNASHSS